ncbi:hypothetical protein R5R35_012196 [Gryllus longicercus]|uniref:GH16 domain-containing protein n=1 Tax=Gryllus longicercus TaxID=2509291 RepID=A0AAN9VYC7_9ORTH
MAATSAAARGARGLLVLLLAAAAVGRVRARARPGEVLIWNDEFDVLDTRVWNHLVTASRGFNDEFQYYRDNWRNSYVRNGVLYLQPTLTAEEFGEAFLYDGRLHYPDCNLSPCVSEAGKDIVVPVQSARIRTLGSFGFRYGRLVVRAQLPRGDWLWPAIWLKPVDNAYGPWPRSGEMDLMEARGNKKLVTAAGVSRGVDRVASTLHFGVNKTHRSWRHTTWEMALPKGEDFSQAFHLYEMHWTPRCISFAIDGRVIGAQEPPPGGFWKLGNLDHNPGGKDIWADGGDMAPFDKPFFIVMNVAVGGRFFGDGLVNSPHPKPWNWSSPQPMRDFWERRAWWLPTWGDGGQSALKVDYVRVYAPAESNGFADNACADADARANAARHAG